MLEEHRIIPKKGKKMEKVYWDEKEQQIKSKDGKCLLDKSRVDRICNLHDGRLTKRCEIIEQRLDIIKNRVAQATEYHNDLAIDVKTIKAQLRCAAKTGGKHKMVFERKKVGSDAQWVISKSGGVWQAGWNGLVFKCSVCGLEITKTKKELTKKEAEYLKGLHLL